MSRYDDYISASIASEQRARIDFFLKNTDKVYANASADGTKLQQRMETIKNEIIATNREINRLNEEQTSKKERGDPGYDAAEYHKQLVKQFPELSDPRCMTHPMRPVPLEHKLALLQNPDCLGTEAYLKLRWSVPPSQRFYVKVPYSWEYGWRAPDKTNEAHFGRVFNLNSTWRRNTLAMFIKDEQIPAPTFW